MSIFYRDGQYYRDEATPERKKQALAAMQADQQWLAQHAQVVPARGTKDPSASWRMIEEKFGSHFLDEIRAAEGSDRMLLSEDHVLRRLARSEFGVDGVWLQPVLMKALDAKVMTVEEYLRAMLALIDANEEFISVNGAILYRSLRGIGGHALPPDFLKLANRLGGPKADVSHVPVALEAVALTWRDRSLTATVQQAMLGVLLQNLTKGRTLEETQAIIAGVVAFAERKMRGLPVVGYVRDWLRGHFIVD
jgi:hypothetical protein